MSGFSGTVPVYYDHPYLLTLPPLHSQNCPSLDDILYCNSPLCFFSVPPLCLISEENAILNVVFIVWYLFAFFFFQ